MSDKSVESTTETTYNCPNTRPYQQKEVLRELHYEEGLNQTEIADKFDVDQSTIHYHLKKHDLLKEQTKKDFYFITLSNGKVSVRPSGDDEQSFYMHQLNACLNHDPHEVFDPDNDVHHTVEFTYALDLPENLIVMDHGNHRSRHDEGTAECHISAVLDLIFDEWRLDMNAFVDDTTERADG